MLLSDPFFALFPVPIHGPGGAHTLACSSQELHPAVLLSKKGYAKLFKCVVQGQKGRKAQRCSLSLGSQMGHGKLDFRIVPIFQKCLVRFNLITIKFYL